MRVFDLIGVVREPLTSVLSGGPLMLPGSVAPDDQEALLALLQTRCAPTPLRRVEVDLRGGFTEPARRLLTRLTADRGANGMLLVLRHGTTALLREVLADPLLRAVPRVVAVVAHPGGEEDLTAWSELGRAVRLALHASFRERASELGVPADALDAWHEYFETLTNPCALVRLANEIVEASYLTQGGEAAHRDLPRFPGLRAFDTSPGAHVSRGLVEHELAWRPWSELLVLVALATAGEGQCSKILGNESYARILAGLEAQGLWHPEEGLRDWATRFASDPFWRTRVGRGRPLPTAAQRAEGWDARCDDLCADVDYLWVEPVARAERTPFLARIWDLDTALGGGASDEEVNALVDELTRRAPTEGTTPRERTEYFDVISRVSARRGDTDAAIDALYAALREAPTDTPRVRLALQATLGLRLSQAERHDDAIEILTAGLATGDLSSLPRHRAELLTYLGLAHAAVGAYEAAYSAFHEALALHRDAGSTHLNLANTCCLLARSSRDCGRHEEASKHAVNAMLIARQLRPASDDLYAEALELACTSLLVLHESVGARNLLHLLVDLADRDAPPSSAVAALRNAVEAIPDDLSALRDEFAPELTRLEARAAAR